MKKILLVMMLGGLLVGCGEKKIELVSGFEKVKIVKNLIKNPKALPSLQNTLKELKMEMKKGNKVAKSEYEQWVGIIRSERSKNNDYKQMLDNI